MINGSGTATELTHFPPMTSDNFLLFKKLHVKQFDDINKSVDHATLLFFENSSEPHTITNDT